MPPDPLPFLDLARPGFSTRGADVHAARAASWCARTPYGLAVLRHREAGQILRDRRFRQGSHRWPDTLGLTGSFANFWGRSIISQEGPAHKRLRRVVQEAMPSAYLDTLAPAFTDLAAGLVDGLRGVETFDFVASVSGPFAGQVIAHLLGQPVEAAPGIAADASTLGLAMGPEAPQHQSRFNAACDRLMDLADQLLDARPKANFVARLTDAADALGVEDRQALKDLIVILIFGGVDTTRAQLAFVIALCIDDPDRWRALRDHPEQVPAAIEDAIRSRPTTTWSSREAVEDVVISGVPIPAGETLHILTHATATDPEVVENHRFDPTAPRPIHFGFGGGAHHCLGHYLARLDMERALSVLVSRWEAISWGGTPSWLPDSGNTSPRQMPVRPYWA